MFPTKPPISGMLLAELAKSSTFCSAPLSVVSVPATSDRLVPRLASETVRSYACRTRGRQPDKCS